mmetsp:Transcript_112753/g.351591  ORF Transcript_112753/g.351591 Transcript_112753/m.351591 type:complete len:241 (-) Transcript_112753:435-1157(-)
MGHDVVGPDGVLPVAQLHQELHGGERQGHEEGANRQECRDVPAGVASIRHLQGRLVSHGARHREAHNLHGQVGDRDRGDVVLALFGLLLPRLELRVAAPVAAEPGPDVARQAEGDKQQESVQSDGHRTRQRARGKRGELLHLTPREDGREGRHVREKGRVALDLQLPSFNCLLIARRGFAASDLSNDHVHRSVPAEKVDDADQHDPQVAFAGSRGEEVLQDETDEEAVDALEDQHGGEDC